MGSLQGGGIVGAVAGDGHHFAFLLEGFHQSLLVHRTGTGNNLQSLNAFQQSLVGESGKLGAGNHCFVGVLVGPQSYLATNLAGRSGGVACHNLHFDASVKAFLNGGRHVGAHRVADGAEGLKRGPLQTSPKG